MAARTIRLDATGIDPFAVGARSGLLWSRGDLTLAGVGTHTRLPLGRTVDDAAAAQRALTALAGDDDVVAPGTGPVAFAALDFSTAVAGELLVPKVVIGRDGEGRRWITAHDVSTDDALALVHATLGPPDTPGRLVPPEPTRFDVTSVLTPEEWRDRIVGEARDRIASGALRKVVLARELRLRTDAPLDRAAVIERLRATFPTAIVYAVQHFIGASPELLVARSGDVVRAHPLAGTAPRAADPATDQRRAAQLLASAKDRHEHSVTIDWFLDTLLPFCSYVDAEPEPSIVTLANVHHLGTLVEGRLSTPAPSVLELVAALHPTPAVGGDPQGAAVQLIGELERAERGRYAGPTGWVDAAGNGAFAVAIRSAELAADGQEARLFAGVGVVEASDPQTELDETRAKFAAMLGALVRP